MSSVHHRRPVTTRESSPIATAAAPEQPTTAQHHKMPRSRQRSRSRQSRGAATDHLSGGEYYHDHEGTDRENGRARMRSFADRAGMRDDIAGPGRDEDVVHKNIHAVIAARKHDHGRGSRRYVLDSTELADSREEAAGDDMPARRRRFETVETRRSSPSRYEPSLLTNSEDDYLPDPGYNVTRDFTRRNRGPYAPLPEMQTHGLEYASRTRYTDDRHAENREDRSTVMKRYDRDIPSRLGKWPDEFSETEWQYTHNRAPALRDQTQNSYQPLATPRSLRPYGSTGSSQDDPDDLKLFLSPSLQWQRLNCAGRLLLFLVGFLVMYFSGFRRDSVPDAVKAPAISVKHTESTTVERAPSLPVPSEIQGQSDMAKPIAILVGSAAPVVQDKIFPVQQASTKVPSTSVAIAEESPHSTTFSTKDVHSLRRLESPPPAINRENESLPIGSADAQISHGGKGPASVLSSDHNLEPVASPQNSERRRPIVSDLTKPNEQHSINLTVSRLPVHDPHYINHTLNGSSTTSEVRPDIHLHQMRPAEFDQTQSRGNPMPDSLLDKFKDLDPKEVPKGQYPLLNWNYAKVLDPTTEKQVFSLARGDHVATFKPLCILPGSEKVVVKSEIKVCSGYNRTAEWMVQYCDTVEDAFNRESFLQFASRQELGSKEPSLWISDNEAANKVHWIDGLTIIHAYDRSCGNIAHFAGRALFLQHIIDNVQAYSAPPHAIENIMILPNADVMKRFRFPHNYAYWHKTLFRAIVTPSLYNIGTLGNFIYRTSKIPFDGTPRVQLVYNLSLAGSNLEGDKVVCFKRAIVPGFLKSRFFVDDTEYPSLKPSLQSKMQGAPPMSRDAIRLRERVSALVHKSPAIKSLSKRIVFVDRTGARRNIPRPLKINLFEMLKAAAEKRGYTFEVVSFERMTFAEQVQSIENAGVVIGVHGANLVNSMFMPPMSVLFELFPFKFTHGMYEQGGAAGLKYFSYMMSTGAPFQTSKPFRNVEQCIRFDHGCKVHYRDAALDINSDDMAAIERVLANALDWCDAVIGQLSAPKKRRRLASILYSKVWSQRHVRNHDNAP
jgi:Glycosyltransferase 61